MQLNEEERQIMVNLEYEKAQSFLEQAERIASMDLWDVVANRLYYSIFHAVSALLIKDGHKVSTHKGTLVMSKLYVKLQMMREESDYNCVYVTTADEMQPLFEPVREFIAKIGNLIKE